jgi:sulfur carrier protein
MIKLFLNGAEREFDAPLSVLELLRRTGLAERRVAVEVNREIVPRSEHTTRALTHGDRVEIVHALGGG